MLQSFVPIQVIKPFVGSLLPANGSLAVGPVLCCLSVYACLLSHGNFLEMLERSQGTVEKNNSIIAVADGRK